jgi:hypothetical protein
MTAGTYILRVQNFSKIIVIKWKSYSPENLL